MCNLVIVICLITFVFCTYKAAKNRRDELVVAEAINYDLGGYMSRPWCCMDRKCTPLINFHDHKDISIPEEGKSIFCWGKMDKMIKFNYNGVEHNNDINFCCYTPLKGCIKFQVNKDDLELLKIGCARAFEKFSEIVE